MSKGSIHEIAMRYSHPEVRAFYASGALDDWCRRLSKHKILWGFGVTMFLVFQLVGSLTVLWLQHKRLGVLLMLSGGIGSMGVWSCGCWGWLRLQQQKPVNPAQRIHQSS